VLKKLLEFYWGSPTRPICITDRRPKTAKIHFELNRRMFSSWAALLQDIGHEVSQSQRRRRYSPTPTRTTIPSVIPRIQQRDTYRPTLRVKVQCRCSHTDRLTVAYLLSAKLPFRFLSTCKRVRQLTSAKIEHVLWLLKWWSTRIIDCLIICVYISELTKVNIVIFSCFVFFRYHFLSILKGKTSICIAHLVATSHL